MSLVKPIARPIARSIARPIIGGSAVWTPPVTPLLWLDASDLTTLFQDTAATTPVTTTGQDVQAIVSKGSIDATLTQGTTPPVFRDVGGLRYLDWTGGKRGLVAASLGLTGHETLSVVTAFQKLSDAATAVVFNHNGSTNPAVNFHAPFGAATNTRIGLNAGTPRVIQTTLAAPATRIASHVLRVNNQTPSIRQRYNGGAWGNENNSAGALANFGGGQFSVGAFGATTNLFPGYIYQLFLFPGVLSDTDFASVEAFAAEKAGISL